MAFRVEKDKAVVQMDKDGNAITKYETKEEKKIVDGKEVIDIKKAIVPWFIEPDDEENRKEFGVQEIVLRKLKVREWAYSLDEFMSVKPGGGVNIKVGAMLLATFPKSVEKAPFEIKDNSVLEATLGLGQILEITNALMELNGLGGDSPKK